MGKRGYQPNHERLAQAAAMRASGMTYREIGEVLGTTGENARQLVARHEKGLAHPRQLCESKNAPGK